MLAWFSQCHAWLTPPQPGFVKPACILRSVQLICYTWFSQCHAWLTPTQPNFTAKLYNITLHTYVLPNLPPVLYSLAYPHPPNNPADLVSITDGSNSGLSLGQSMLSGISTPSGIMTAGNQTAGTSGVGAGTGGGHSKGSLHSELKPNQSLIQLIDPRIKVKDLMGTNPPPLMDDGTQLCLSFLI
jgi:hypothetical protein